MASTTVVTLTMNPAVDLATTVEQVVPDDKLRCARPVRTAGGGGLNVAKVVAALGQRVVAVYPAGGSTGSSLHDLVGAAGITRAEVPITGETRENLVVVEPSTRRHFHFVMPGPELGEAEWSACLDAVCHPGLAPTHVIASGSLPPGVPVEFYAMLARRVRDLGARFVLDAAGAPLAAALDVGVWMIKPNLVELAALTGIEHAHEDALERAATALVDDGRAELVVLSLGPAGAFAVGRGYPGEHVRAPIVPVRSRVGAGDSMVGGVVVADRLGLDMPACVRLGAAAGAAAVMRRGAEVCAAQDVWRLARRVGVDLSATG
ncbi:MAG TPA: hexose kinase [Thermoleophilia bacterium]|nr:hexose kinase [Thermoleophilia bacterium]